MLRLAQTQRGGQGGETIPEGEVVDMSKLQDALQLVHHLVASTGSYTNEEQRRERERERDTAFTLNPPPWGARSCEADLCTLDKAVLWRLSTREQLTLGMFCGRLTMRSGSWESNPQGLTSWVWLPKFCRIFGVLREGSSAGFLPCKPFRRTLLQNPKGFAEFEDQLVFLVEV